MGHYDQDYEYDELHGRGASAPSPRANTLMERMERMEKMYEDLFVKYTILEMNYQQLTRNLSGKGLSKYSGNFPHGENT